MARASKGRWRPPRAYVTDIPALATDVSLERPVLGLDPIRILSPVMDLP